MGRSSISPQERQLLCVEIGVSEELLAYAGPFHEEADVELISHAHAAMHLHALLHRARRGRARARLAYRHGRTGFGEVCIELLQRLHHRGPGDLDIDVELRGTMLQRLEFADELAKLLALLQILHRSAEHLLAQAHHFGRNCRAADVEHTFAQRVSLTYLTQHAVGIDFYIIELNARRVVGVQHNRARGRDSLRLRSTRNRVRPSRSPIALAVRAATIRRSARCPSITSAFAPLSLKPFPERTACSAVCNGRCLVPSSMASVASSEPDAIFGR